jgi:hypothetical protein
MTLLTNSAEGGTNGITVSTSNSGGASGNAFDATSIPAGGSLNYSSTQAAHGTLSIQCATSTIAAGDYVQWSTSMGTLAEQFGRVYVYLTSAPAGNDVIVRYIGGSTVLARLQVTTGRVLRLLDTSSTVVATFTNTVPLNAWCRIEWDLTFPASATASATVKLFLTPDSGTADETQTPASNGSLNFGSANITSVRFGWTNGVANQPNMFIDDLGVSSTGYLGPAATTWAGAAALSGSGAVSAAGAVSRHPGASLSGSGTVTETVTLGYAAALSGSGSVSETIALGYSAALSGAGSVSETVTLVYPAALGGSGSLSVPGEVKGFSAALSGTGTAGAAGAVTWAAPAAFSGAGALSVPGEVKGYSAVLAGTGSLQVAGAALGFSAALSGSGAVAVPGVTLGYVAALAGTGALSVPGIVLGYSAALTGSGAVAVPGEVLGFSAALTGSGALSGAVTLGYQALLTGLGTMAAAGSMSGQQQGAAALSGSGALAVPGVTLGYSSALSGTGALAAAVTLGYAAGLSGSGTLAAPGVVLGFTVALSGGGTVTAAWTLAIPGAAGLAGTGAVTAGVTLGYAAGLTGSGAIAVPGVTLGYSAALAGAGLLAASGSKALPGGAGLSGTGLLAAAWLVTTPAPVTGTWLARPLPGRWQTSLLPSRWRAVPLPPRWKVVVVQFEPVAAVSVEYVNILWTADLAGTGTDPTGQTPGQPELTVQFAAPVSSGDILHPAQPVTWYLAVWLTGTNIRGYVAQAAVGPTGGSPAGVVQLTSGVKYDLWSRILGNPEAPARFAGVLPVY